MSQSETPANEINEAISDLEGFQKTMKEASEKTEDVKEGVATPEEEQQEPGYRLYQQIVENSIKIMQLPTFTKGVKMISEAIGPDVTKVFIEMMALSMTHAAHSAVVFYDELLKEELTKQFNAYGEAINKTAGTVNGHTGVLEVFRERISKIEKRLQIEDLATDDKHASSGAGYGDFHQE